MFFFEFQTILEPLLKGGSMMEMCEKVVSKRYLVFTFVAFMMVGLLISHSYGEEVSQFKYGFSVFGGRGDAWHNKPHVEISGLLPRIDLALYRNWHLEFEGNFSYWDISTEKDFYFLGVNANILFKPIQRKWGSLFILAGGGLGYDSAGKKVSEIGDSHCGGILQTGAGIYYNLGKGLALRAEYRFYHISDPFRSDRGLNTHNALLGISF
jgi:opacity protein-like surface antigen